MLAQKMLTNVAAYNQWANESIIAWLKDQPQDLLQKDLASSGNSLVKALNHILAVEEFWYSVVTGTPFTSSARYVASTFDVEEILGSLATTSRQFAAFVASLEEAAMLESIRLDYPWVQGTMQRYELIQHVFNHSTHHRGQVMTLARIAGITGAPMLDLNVFLLSRTQVTA